MEALSVGMYVRTKNGMKIGKIAQIHKAVNHKSWYELKNGLRVYSYEKINEPSYNIIDILEKGDYVNGSEVLYFENRYIEEDDKFVPIGVITENCCMENADSWIIEKDIKTVITHEQIEQMAYKVDE